MTPRAAPDEWRNLSSIRKGPQEVRFVVRLCFCCEDVLWTSPAGYPLSRVSHLISLGPKHHSSGVQQRCSVAPHAPPLHLVLLFPRPVVLFSCHRFLFFFFKRLPSPNRCCPVVCVLACGVVLPEPFFSTHLEKLVCSWSATGSCHGQHELHAQCGNIVFCLTSVGTPQVAR